MEGHFGFRLLDVRSETKTNNTHKHHKVSGQADERQEKVITTAVGRLAK